jgi:hypothetical protein
MTPLNQQYEKLIKEQFEANKAIRIKRLKRALNNFNAVLASDSSKQVPPLLLKKLEKAKKRMSGESLKQNINKIRRVLERLVKEE